MKRHLLTAASAISLLVCVTTAGMWVQSYRRPDRYPDPFIRDDPDDLTFPLIYVESRDGSVEIFVKQDRQPGDSPFLINSYHSALVVRYRSVLLVAIILPLLWFALAIGRGRAKSGPGSCANCGYNLAGNTSGVCPECGTPVPPKAEVIA